ncbi:MAG: translation elongation factor Ts [marine benthic group bacterium]|jgi:elongation factor Ts|nr:translation elongation factor Ts [Gemmatimonadota bacterium]MCL7962727.1 translation elongation factor Ts [Candidatus Carthagonibacter metallireducens]MCL7956725.1 translation elongation factor Ts [Gemmatimonadota bacterium]MCL7964777.1 translation elongation factor Ts [Gemmatimonadota bacterium]MCL7967548.1 translation elongation factor Ts [Gemmatimonadota bacterium]
MAEITAKAVKSLRDRTGAGMMDCKKALLEAGGDEEQAIDLLRQWGAAKAAKRAERETSEGLVRIVNRDGVTGMVAVSSETDFVARNEEFQDFADRLAEAVIEADLPDGETLTGEALLGRPEFESFAAEIVDLRSKIGENIQVHRAVRTETGDSGATATYLHFGDKIGVVVELEGATGAGVEELAREVAMHVAAARPAGVRPEDIPAEVRERERAVLTEQTKAEGKPEPIVEKIVDGRMRKYFEQNSLVMQAFVKDPDRTIADLLEAHADGLTVRRFIRFEIGE